MYTLDFVIETNGRFVRFENWKQSIETEDQLNEVSSAIRNIGGKSFRVSKNGKLLYTVNDSGGRVPVDPDGYAYSICPSQDVGRVESVVLKDGSTVPIKEALRKLVDRELNPYDLTVANVSQTSSRSARTAIGFIQYPACRMGVLSTPANYRLAYIYW